MLTTTIAKRGTKATLVIKGARVFDPAMGIDATTDVTVEKGVITRIGSAGKSGSQGAQVINATGLLLLPGFVDLHTHLRSPGREDEEDMGSGTRAAAAGGYVTICAMPNTDPVVDNAAVIASLAEVAESDALVRVAFIGAISRGQKGEHLSDLWDMAGAGAVAFSDDGRPVTDSGILRSAFQAACMSGLPLSLHCEDPVLAGAGVMNEGEVSARLGLAGISCASESADVARNLEIALYENAPVHIAHISCARSLELIGASRKSGAQVTCEVTPHHLTLTDIRVAGLDSNHKMNPPLRGEDDRKALAAALVSGVIDCIATDHAPHATQEKETPFEEAPFGVIGLETAFPVLFTELVETGEVPLDIIVQAMSSNPAKSFGLPVPAISEGEEANLCLVDTDNEFEIEPASFQSKSRNTPFAGMKVKGRVQMTLAAGRVAYRGEMMSL